MVSALCAEVGLTPSSSSMSDVAEGPETFRARIAHEVPMYKEIIDKAGAAFSAALSGQMSTSQANQTANDAAVQVLKDHGYPVGTYSGATLPWDQSQ